MLQVISANRLRDGRVVYVGAESRWVETFSEAMSFDDLARLETALAQAKADERANLIVDVVAVDAVGSRPALRPAHLREAIRAGGPTVHPERGEDGGALSPGENSQPGGAPDASNGEESPSI